jgi:DNA ligase-1
LKRHEEKGAGLNDTIDAVVLGYYKGKGKRAKFGIGAFLVGLYHREKDQFETVAKVGTGLSDEQWLELKKKCDAHERHEKPVNVSCAPELEPDVWVYPEITVIIRADEITLSPSHTAGGMALRFPRFIDYCVDKTPTQVTSVHELKRLYDIQH